MKKKNDDNNKLNFNFYRNFLKAIKYHMNKKTWTH